MTTYHHGHLRAAVLDAAGKLIERGGPKGLSVREAARRAGVSHNAPYRHFPDRDALVSALATEGFALLHDSLKNLSGRALGAAYVRFALDHPQRFRLMFAGHPGLRAQAESIRELFAAGFAGVETGPKLAATAAWSLVHGLAGLVLDGHMEASPEFVAKVLGAIRFAVTPQRSA